MRVLLVLLTFIFGTVPIARGAAIANEINGDGIKHAIAVLDQQAQRRQLHDAPYWHALLHYHVSGIPLSQDVTSNVISPEFFLAADGGRNPASELAATISAMYAAPMLDNNQHPQCRFIARYQWLRQQLDWRGLTQPPTIRCEQFEQWSKHGQIVSVSLVFATGYLSNPASLYGHMLIRFDTKNSSSMAGLLDPSMSYGAVVPRHENGVMYMLRGLFGGYDAGFSHDQFFQHHHGYAEEELRDLWEYRLDLAPDDVERIVAHSWELLRVRFKYYFLSDNCAYEVSELLAVVVDDPLLPELPWSIPSTILNGLDKTRINGKPIIETVTRIPSRQNRFYESYELLDEQQRDIVRRYIDGTPLKEQGQFQAMEQQRKIEILTSLINYYEFQAAANSDKQRFRKQKHELLTERFRLPVGTTVKQTELRKPPHEGNGPMLVQLSAVHNQHMGNGLGLRVRPAYYDMLSLEPGRFPFSSLSMFDAQLMLIDDSLFLRSLDLVSITSLNLSQTGLPGDGGHAWKLRFGGEQQNLACDDCGVFELEGGIGEAVSLADDFAAFALLDARVQTTADNYGSLAAGAHAGFTKNWSDTVAVSAVIGHRSYINGNFASYPFAKVEVRVGTSREWDIRFKYERNVESEIGAAVSLYW